MIHESVKCGSKEIGTTFIELETVKTEKLIKGLVADFKAKSEITRVGKAGVSDVQSPPLNKIWGPQQIGNYQPMPMGQGTNSFDMNRNTQQVSGFGPFSN